MYRKLYIVEDVNALVIIKMEKLFKNRKRLKPIDFIYQQFSVVVTALIVSLIGNLFTWSKPELNDILRFMIIFEIYVVIRMLIYISRKHLDSVYIDYDSGMLIIKKFWAFKQHKIKTLQLNELMVSEIKHFPITSFTIFISFSLRDNQNIINISSAEYGIKENEIKEIHKKLHNT